MGIFRETSFSVAFFNVHFHLNEKTLEKGENCSERIPSSNINKNMSSSNINRSNINKNMSIYVWTVFSISLVYIIQIAKRILYSTTIAYFSPSTVGSNIQRSSYKKLKSLRFIG